MHVHPPHARALHRPRGRAEDQADAALGQRAAPHRHPARHAAVPLRGRAVAGHPQEDRAVRARCRRRRSSRPATSTTSTRCRSASASRASTTSSSSTSALEAAPRRPRASGSELDRARRRAPTQPVRIALVGKYVAARGRLPVGRRGAAPLRLPARRRDRDRLGRLRDARADERGRASASRGADGILIPGGFGGRGIEGKIRAARVARERGIPYLGICLGMQMAVSRVRAPRRRHGRRELDRVRPRDAVPGDRPAARAEGGRRPRRHDAPGRRPDQAARGHAGARDLRRGRHLRAPPPPLRGQQLPAQAARGRRASSCSGTSPDERLVEVIELARPPVLRRLAVPPRVQVAPRAPRAAVPRLRRRRAGARDASARAGGRAARAAGEPQQALDGGDGRPREAERAARSNDTVRRAVPRSRARSADERACADAWPRELRALGLEVAEDDAAAATGADAATCSRASPGARERSILLCAHLDTVPHGGADRAGARRRRLGERATTAILGADNKAAVAVLLALARRARVEGSPVGLELLFTVGEENGAGGRQGVRRVAAAPRVRLRLRPRLADRRGRRRLADLLPHRGRLPRPRRARRHPPRGRPQRDPRRRARDRRDAARAPRRARRPRTSARSTAASGATNVVPERCAVLAEARSLDDARVEDVVAEIVDRCHDARQRARLRVRRRRRRRAPVRRLPPRGRGARRSLAAEAALRACGYEPRADRHRRRLGRQRASRPAASRASTSPTAPSATTSRPSASAVAALEGMLDVAFALLDEAAAA